MGLKFTHVAYRGAAPAIQDVMSGHTPFMFADSASCYQFIAAGKVQAMGVASASRMRIIPELPTLAEQGLKGFEAYAWQGVSVPAGTPQATIKALNQALNQALNSTAVKARFQTLGIDPLPSTPEQMTNYARTERERWGRLIRANNIRID
jgi:tripartite-type tricarboxylate transporter receptor subunit TctC